MSFSIAVAGKGGTGKTSLSSLIIRYLQKKGSGPILAIDADPNANLADSLGLDVDITIGSIIASFNSEKINIPPGMTKEAYLDIKMNGAITESKGLDLITMGRGEGPECYCYPNALLRKFADDLSGNYAYVVMDNEAGMEHLSRRTTQNIDVLLIVSDHSVKGVRTIARIMDLVSELKLVVGRQIVIINSVQDELAPRVKEELELLGIESPVVIPRDEAIYQFDLEARPLVELPDDSEAVTAINNLMDEILSAGKVGV
ncbi:MAG: carbon monoxide dehydrogenase [Chloroflexi bacterium RBG_13_46_14]|nr:MAG: carbon monoxide dehydrogenase [Chloroflexi bacterium RBG_13_46_14]